MEPRAHARWTASRLGAWVLVLSLFLPTVARPEGEAPAPKQSPSTGPTDVRELEAFLDGVMREQLEAYRIPGAVIAVVKDGRLLLAKGYGYSNLERREPVIAERTLFRIGSVSKLFTWTAVMQLAEQGRLDLDADVNTYLRDFQIPATWRQPITLRHLLCHTAGFEERLPATVSSADELAPLGKLLTRSMPARVHPPGEVGAYSNYGAMLAGYIIEQVSGRPFEQYIEENILKPLDMRHSTFRQPLPPGLAPDMSTGYLVNGGVPLAVFARAVPSWSLAPVQARHHNGGGHAHTERPCPTRVSRGATRALHAGLRAHTGSTGDERAARHRGRSVVGGATHAPVEAPGRQERARAHLGRGPR
ncbi:serine hydrolase domain-containing protein [Archangium lansingense]|uniref:Serine hydrolase n=1 Tax=Archangium lansingense TaxID=2995310 RepID=A0ABT4AC85_9BACT|nr:serine hydrolase domain-containing protein [Archangium lansinium]MCY1079289.1 serine hydrolase [Archangium lansinium]